jgi:hypothetical protein
VSGLADGMAEQMLVAALRVSIPADWPGTAGCGYSTASSCLSAAASFGMNSVVLSQ